MDLLANLWDTTTSVFGGALGKVERGITAVFGSSNARYIKRLDPTIAQINALEDKYKAMSDAELREQTAIFRKRLAEGETLDDLLIEAFAVCREGGRRFLNMRHYDVQLIGGIVLHRGSIAEMVTGEGKTLVATLPAYLNGLEGKGVHVVTVNDYLARRDMEWMGPLYLGLGLTVGAIQSDMPVAERQHAYGCDITYGTNNEFGFDYLRDNMRIAARGDDRFPKAWQQSQGKLNYAIIDEVDNILVDEARTPLIISGPAHDNPRKYADADRIARSLKKDVHFEVKEKEHTAHMTDEGVREAEKLAGVESFYTAGNMEWPHLIDNALKAHHLYKRDVNYVVENGKVVIVDEFTGRKMEGRQWSDGLHQAVEAKEGVQIKEETQTLATITLQNFFKLYNKLCGMTGTAMTEANEFWKIYKLDVVAIPTNRDMERIEYTDQIYRSEREKFQAVADEIERLHRYDTLWLKNGEMVVGAIAKESDGEVEIQPRGEKNRKKFARSEITSVQKSGRPVLVGTTSIEKSERLSNLLSMRGIPHEVLNAKHHRREAQIVAQAGRKGAVTIATNMAGRGTDIVLGGNPETLAWAELQDQYPTRLDVPREVWDAKVAEIEAREKMKIQGEEVKRLGGLHVVGTERHESRRIDLQLRGRCGRQGDPGSSRFYLSLEDDLIRVFGGEWVKWVMDKLNLPEGEAIESPMVTRRIQGAQKKVEERNFERRKSLLEYDEVMDEQRKRVYGYRQKVLDGADCKALIQKMISQEIDRYYARFLDPNYGVEAFASWASAQLHLTSPLEARDLRGMDFTMADEFARGQAERLAETDIFEKIEENLSLDDEEVNWNWDAMARYVNARFGTGYRDRDLKKIGRDDLAEELIGKAHEWVAKVDLSEGKPFLSEDFGLLNALEWTRRKFGVEIGLDEARALEPPALKELAKRRAREAYEMRESEYPVLTGMYRFTRPGAAGQTRIDREGLVEWAARRFETHFDLEDIKSKQRQEIRETLLEQSRAYRERERAARQEVEQKLEAMFKGAHDGKAAASGNGALESLSDWVHEALGADLPEEEIAEMSRDELRDRLEQLVDDRYRPEMSRMEREILLQLVDMAWKEHLLAMDHLRSSINLVGYAQLDAKVEFKREGMKLFEEMWNAIHERVTDLVFRMENLDQEFVKSTWVETAAKHADAGNTASEMALEKERRGSGSPDQPNPDEKIEPIRNVGQRVGRNDPCPCGSGKKYKHCHMRQGGVGGPRVA